MRFSKQPSMPYYLILFYKLRAFCLTVSHTEKWPECHRRSYIKIDDYLGMKGSRIKNIFPLLIIMYMNITWDSTANKVTVAKRGT